jgi:hypothetical protein
MPYQLTFVAMHRADADSLPPAGRLNILYDMASGYEALGLTGLFLDHGDRHLYCIEGDEDVVAARYGAIKVDPSIEGVVVLRQRTVEDRSFRRWSFALDHDPRDDQPLTLEDRVVALLFGVPAEIRRTFLAFARLDDQAQRY